MSQNTNGIVLLNTGDGKGKSTAAFGLLLRACGHGLRGCVFQFIKAETGQWGERKAAEKLGVAWFSLGDGFTWKSRDMDETIAKARHGWRLTQEKIVSGEFDLIILDEFTYPLHFGWLPVEEVIAWLKENKPSGLHLVITGRNAPPELIEYADLVTEMTKIKHPFDAGCKAQKGIEF